MEKSKIRELESRLNLLPADPSVTSKRLGPKRTVFAESIEEAREIKASFDPSSAPTQVATNISAEQMEKLMTLQSAGYKELSERLDRAEKLKLIIQKREAKNKLMVI